MVYTPTAFMQFAMAAVFTVRGNEGPYREVAM